MGTKLTILFQIFLILVFITGVFVIAEFYARKEKEGINTNNECSNLLIKREGKVLLYNTEKPLEDNVNPIVFSHLDEYIQYLEIERKDGKQCPLLFLKEETAVDVDKVSYTITTPPTAGDLFENEFNATPIPGGNIDASFSENLENPQNRNTSIPTNLIINTMTPYNDNNDKTFYYSVTGFITNNFTKPFSDFVLSSSSLNVPREHMANPVNVIDASRESKKYNIGQYPGFDPTSQYQGRYTNIDVIHDSTAKQDKSDNPMDENWGGVMYTQDQVNSGKYDDYNIYRPSLVQPKFSYGSHTNPVGGPVDILEPEKSPHPLH